MGYFRKFVEAVYLDIPDSLIALADHRQCIEDATALIYKLRETITCLEKEHGL